MYTAKLILRVFSLFRITIFKQNDRQSLDICIEVWIWNKENNLCTLVYSFIGFACSNIIRFYYSITAGHTLYFSFASVFRCYCLCNTNKGLYSMLPKFSLKRVFECSFSHGFIFCNVSTARLDVVSVVTCSEINSCMIISIFKLGLMLKEDNVWLIAETLEPTLSLVQPE